MSEWISVDERLPPEERGSYLVVFGKHGDIYISEWLEDTDMGWCFWQGDPTHWMPLPEPPPLNAPTK